MIDAAAARRSIAERRAARANVADFRAGWNPNVSWRVSREAGWARHPSTTLDVELANKSIANVTDERGPHWGEMRGLCMEAVHDGYSLGAAVSGVTPKGDGAAFSRATAQGTFVSKACQSGEALLASEHAALANEICDHWANQLPDEVREMARRAIANAVAAGAQLFACEFPTKDAWFAALKLAAKKRAKETATGKAPPAPHLVDAILAAPDDDEVRLVYGDWLTEHADPLGEFIQIQCALGRALIGAGGKYASREGRKLPFESRQELEAREKELLKKNEKEWLAPIRPFIRQWRFRRGFVDHVIADAGIFLGGLEAIYRAPITSVQLTGFKPAHADALRKAAPHPSIQSIEFSQNRIGPKNADLLASPFFSRAVRLNVWGNPLGDDGMATLAELEFPLLRGLTLSTTEITGKGILALSNAKFWPRLEELDLAFNRGVDESCLPAFERATSLRKVRAPMVPIADRIECE